MSLDHVDVGAVCKLSAIVHFSDELIPLHNVKMYDCGHVYRNCRWQFRQHFTLVCCSLRVAAVPYAA